jgi:hypothetical protein
MLDPQRVDAVAKRLAAQIQAGNSTLLEKFPIETSVRLLDEVPEFASYRHLGPELEGHFAQLEAHSDARTAELYHRLLLARLALTARQKLANRRLPDEVKASCEEQFERILNEIETDLRPPGFYRHSEDAFCKDLAVCTLKLIPIQGRVCEWVRFPTRTLFSGGWRQSLEGMVFLLLEAGGRAPFLEEHWATHDPGFKEKFTFEGMIRYYRLVAEIMKLDKRIKGHFGTGWMNDPQVERVSPRLAYFWYFHLANGGRMFRTGPSDDATEAATTRSGTRMRLYSEGKYLPTNYTHAWSRKRLIKWADKLSWHW